MTRHFLRQSAVFKTVALLSVCHLALSGTAQAQHYPQTQPAPQYQGQMQAHPLRIMPAPQMQQQNIRGSRYGVSQAPQARRTPYRQPPRGMQREDQQLNFFERLFTAKNRQHYSSFEDRMRGRRLPAHQIRPPMPHPLDGFQRWVETEPEYVLYPGDQIDVMVPSAPELSQTLTVGPDGRVLMPMTDPVMAAGRPLRAIEDALQADLAKQLVDPRVEISPRAYAPQQIFIGGEVGQQGTYTLPGPIGVTEAVMMSGGFRTSAQTQSVVVMRRAPNGGFMARVIDFRDGIANPHSLSDMVQLRRGDIIFVPRSNIAEVGLFMQQYVRDALPFTFNASYNFGNGFSN